MIRALLTLIAMPWLLVAAHWSGRFARKKGLIGADYFFIGRSAAVRSLFKMGPSAFGMYITPVNSVRYFEFAFANECLPPSFTKCLDVSSPRLFSLALAQRYPGAQISMMNPDSRDAKTTNKYTAALGLKNITISNTPVDVLADSGVVYDCVWSLSVIEHIDGPYDDRDAVKWMFNSLGCGGRLILTFPIDRVSRVEYQSHDYYGTQPAQNGRIFFQRVYDCDAIKDRIIRSLGREPTKVSWYGEKSPVGTTPTKPRGAGTVTL